ncbi:MAG: shikimate dehydrogenase [Deltaproteobacteria bacterium]|nr:MAG: shikimate dehydrogenase [Deltaproteobacteria bacterium]
MKIDEDTDLYGVVGIPLRHSLSPVMHTAAFEAYGLNAVYRAFESTNLANTVKGARAMGIRGLSVTIPYKSDIIPLLDRVDPIAEKIGAVNTVVNRDGSLVGYNTDAAGAIDALREVVDPRKKNTVILGSGGAAKAIAYGLKEQGGKVTIAARSKKAGEDLALRLNSAYITIGEIRGMRMDILINATPVGMYPQEEQLPVDLSAIRVETVMDIVYNPLETPLLKKAAALGCRTISGVRMLIFQGAEQFRLWTGLEAPVEAMETAVMKVLT